MTGQPRRALFLAARFRLDRGWLPMVRPQPQRRDRTAPRPQQHREYCRADVLVRAHCRRSALSVHCCRRISLTFPLFPLSFSVCLFRILCSQIGVAAAAARWFLLRRAQRRRRAARSGIAAPRRRYRRGTRRLGAGPPARRAGRPAGTAPRHRDRVERDQPIRRRVRARPAARAGRADHVRRRRVGGPMGGRATSRIRRRVGSARQAAERRPLGGRPADRIVPRGALAASRPLADRLSRSVPPQCIMAPGCAAAGHHAARSALSAWPGPTIVHPQY